MKNQRALIPLLVLVGAAVTAALILASRTEVERAPSVTPPPLVRVVAAEPRDVRLTVHGRGTATAAIETTLVAQVAGRVESAARDFADGGAFRRGEVLLQVDPRDFELAVAQAEAGVAQARVALDRELAEAELARREWADLGLGDAAPLATREPQLQQARASLAAAEAQLEMARLSLDRTAIRAPFDGRIRRKLVDVGRHVSPGTPVAEILSTAYVEVPVPVSQEDLAHLEIDWQNPSAGGPDIALRAEIAGRRRAWRGRVVRVASEIDSRTRTMTLYARVDDLLSVDGEAPMPLPLGAFLEAEIAGRVATDVVVLPRSALREGDRLLVVDADDRLRFRSVEVLRLQEDEVLIRGGLEAGALVCVSPLEAPVDGMAVRTFAAAADVAERL